MLPWLTDRFGNASSRHEYGRAARNAVEEARRRVAHAVGAHSSEVVFTSCGSEANNLFIKGAAAALRPGGIAVSATEHPCVLQPALQLARSGWRIHQIRVDSNGRVDPEAYCEVLRQKPRLLSVIMANNETGTLQDVSALASQSLPTGAWFHTDAVQAFGKVAVDFRDLNSAGIHAMSVSAHKIGGPRGVAALVVDKRVELDPLVSGGGQERGLRSGTENVAAIAGFGVACELAVYSLAERSQVLLVLRDRLEQGLRNMGAQVFGAESARLPNTVYFAISGLDGETLVARLDRAGFAVGSGAACSSANPEPSHVLLAMGVAPDSARGAVRVSLGAGNSIDQVDAFLLELQSVVAKFKQLLAVAV